MPHWFVSLLAGSSSARSQVLLPPQGCIPHPASKVFCRAVLGVPSPSFCLPSCLEPPMEPTIL